MMMCNFMEVFQIICVEVVQHVFNPHRSGTGSTIRLLLALFVLTVATSACGVFGGDDTSAAADMELFRTPHPTFTPTAQAIVQAPVAPQSPAGENGIAVGEQITAPSIPDATFVDPPRAVVSSPLVNLRAEPRLDSTIVATSERGAEYEVIGRSEDANWWQICCHEGQAVWIARELVDTDGGVDLAPVANNSDAVAAVTSAATERQPEVESPGLGGGGADLVQFQLVAGEQFPESSLVRLYLFVYDGANALAGYRVRIEKDGREIPVTVQSFGGQPAFTWPFQDARQRFQNLKIEFPDERPAGNWTVQLTDSQGRPVGPPAVFSLGENDPNQELYVRYERSN